MNVILTRPESAFLPEVTSTLDATLAGHEHDRRVSYDYETNAEFVEEALELNPDATVYSLKARASVAPILEAHIKTGADSGTGDTDASTALLVNVIGTQTPSEVLPPAATDLTVDYHLVSVANHVMHDDVSTSKEGKSEHELPPFLSAVDAITAAGILYNSQIKDNLIDKYDLSSYEHAVLKANAMREANIAETFTFSKDIVRQYNRIRQGAKPDDTMPIITPDRVMAVAETVNEPELHPVDAESLSFSPDEGRVMLSALHMVAKRRGNDPVRVAALDLLSRYEPSPTLRKLYGGMLRTVVDVPPSTDTKVPTYPHAPDRAA